MNWKDLAWFDAAGNPTYESGESQVVFDGTTITSAISGGTLGGESAPWAVVSSSGSVAIATGGSGTSPAIITAADYWLRVENGEVLTDENGEGVSLENT